MAQRHEKKGIPPSARFHVKAISKRGASTAVDVGSGPGSIAIELLKAGVQKVLGIDLSPQMTKYAEKRLKEQGFSPSQFQFRIGNFLEFQSDEKIDAVSVHRVMCCHPEATKIAEKCTELNPKVVANTIPRDWKFLRLLLAPIGWIAEKKGSFRPYVHSQEQIDEIFKKKGYYLKERHRSMFWVTSIYEKED